MWTLFIGVRSTINFNRWNDDDNIIDYSSHSIMGFTTKMLNNILVWYRLVFFFYHHKMERESGGYFSVSLFVQRRKRRQKSAIAFTLFNWRFPPPLWKFHFSFWISRLNQIKMTATIPIGAVESSPSFHFEAIGKISYEKEYAIFSKIQVTMSSLLSNWSFQGRRISFRNHFIKFQSQWRQ